MMGEEARRTWISIDVRGRYRAMNLKISKHAFVSPFEMMEMLMATNVGERSKISYRSRVDRRENRVYNTPHNVAIGE